MKIEILISHLLKYVVLSLQILWWLLKLKQ